MDTPPTEPIQPSQTSPISRILVVSLIISVVTAGISMYVAYDALQKVNRLEKQIAATSETRENTLTPDTTPQSAEPSNLETFSDPNVEGMSFQYDPSEWEVIPLIGADQKVIDGVKYPGAGVYMKEKNGDGYILFSYTLEFGMGGGYSLFENSEINSITSTLTRIQSENRYEYGLTEEIVSFDTSPGEKGKFIGFCEEMAQPDYEGYTAFDPDECVDIANGTITGYAPQPTFSWSLRKDVLTSLKDINPQWYGDAYIQSEGLDKGYMIITTSYTGENPDKADEIVKQLKF